MPRLAFSRFLLGVAVAGALGCQPTPPSPRAWADLPMGGYGQQDETALAELVRDPEGHRGKTIRASVRVVEAHEDARGTWLRVVPWRAPLGAQHVKLLIPKDQPGAEYLEFEGRDLDLVMEVIGPTATMAYENAFIVKPLAHVSRFVPSSRGGDEADEMQRQLESGATTTGP